MRVLFAGGGSGGHLYPALGIARAMVQANAAVDPFFIGAMRGIEREILPETEFPFELLDLHPLYRSQPWLNWRTMASSAGSWRRIARIAAAEPPLALVATGGYASGIALAFARARRIPIVIQDQNSFPGLTVRWFAASAAQLHLGFPEAVGRLKPGKRTVVFDSGNPISAPPPESDRPSRAAAARRWGFPDSSDPVLLVFGGSQGAEAINRAVGAWVRRGTGGVRVIWATGRAHFERYARLENPCLRIVPFISPMSEAYAAADVALSRAGAMTTAELCAWGIPSVLVPLPTAAADHQTANARAIAASGAAVMLPQSELTTDRLASTVSKLVSDESALAGMRQSSLRRARPHAAQDIATKILEMACFK